MPKPPRNPGGKRGRLVNKNYTSYGRSGYNYGRYPATIRTVSNKSLTFKIQVRYTAASTMTTSGSGLLQQQIFCLDPTACTDWAPLAVLYDTYKVTYMKVRYYPCSTVNQLATTGSTYHPIYVSYDPDSSSAATSVDQNLGYDNCKVFNLYKPWQYSCRPRVQGDNSVSNAGMALNYKSAKVGNVLDMALATNYHKGIIQWYADSLPVSTPIGDIVVTYYVLCMDRR